MFYSIRHSTRFRYSDSVRQSVMEVMMHPRSEGNQSVRQFEVSTEPRARIFARRDFLGNIVHHFDIPGAHDQLTVLAEALVEVSAPRLLPLNGHADDWKALDTMVRAGDYWDFLNPSHFCRLSPALEEFIKEIGLERRDDPISLVQWLNRTIYEKFAYKPQTTSADSPIDEALELRAGVCQDFSHIMIALLRQIQIPARYVSGYLYHRSDTQDRSLADATHAWCEVLLPGYNWIGLDPTNNLLATERHIRTAVGRDYSDVPPTRGNYIKLRGKGTGEMKVAVHVTPADAPRPEELEPIGSAKWISIPNSELNMSDEFEEMSHQQQQQ
jgi:transglutaminase-like putative cysteine protease